MRRELSATMGVLVGFIASGVARADWLDDAWSEAAVRMHGNPAVLLSRDGVHVVLPEASLHQAHKEGFTTEQALQDFLDRHGQRCSHLLDLNNPQPNLKVTLLLQRPAPLEGFPEKDEVLAAVKRAYLRDRIDGGSMPLLFAVSPVKFDYSINYMPTHRVRCVAPKDDTMS